MRLGDLDALIGKDVGIAWVSTEAIRNAPTIDAVPVVRCKECVYSVFSTWDMAYFCSRKMLGTVRPTDFCSFGERKDGG